MPPLGREVENIAIRPSGRAFSWDFRVGVCPKREDFCHGTNVNGACDRSGHGRLALRGGWLRTEPRTSPIHDAPAPRPTADLSSTDMNH